MSNRKIGRGSIADTSGAIAERAAQRWLQSRGLKPITRNYRCRMGELDLIMLDGAELVFVEVRLRSHAGYGSAVESITAVKCRRLWQAARHFLACEPRWSDRRCRFDVMAAHRAATGELMWEWLQGAISST